MQAERLREALAAAEVARGDDRYPAEMRVDLDVHSVLVAVRNGLRFAERVQEATSDEQLGQALVDLARAYPTATDLRDVFTHLDEYVLDQGRLQPEGQGKRTGEVEAGSSSWRMMSDGKLVVVFGAFPIKPLVVAAEAIKVLDVAAEVWLRGLREGVDGLTPRACSGSARRR